MGCGMSKQPTGYAGESNYHNRSNLKHRGHGGASGASGGFVYSGGGGTFGGGGDGMLPTQCAIMNACMIDNLILY